MTTTTIPQPSGRPWKAEMAVWTADARAVWAEMADRFEAEGMESKLAEATAFVIVSSLMPKP